MTGNPPAAQTTFFESSWNHATGNTDEALRDGTAWGGIESQSATDLMEVLPGGVDGNNLLRVLLDGTRWGAVMHYDMPTNSAEHFYFRFYMRVHTPNGISYGSMHGIQDLEGIDARSSVTYFGVASASTNGTWSPYVYSYMQQLDGMGRRPGENGGRFNGSSLNCDEWYRVEGHIQFFSHAQLAPTIFELRVYDEGEQLVMDSDDFLTNYVNDEYTETNRKSLREHYDEGDRYTLRGTNVTWMFGNNGPYGAEGRGPMYDVSAVAFGTERWIGGLGSEPGPGDDGGAGDDGGVGSDGGAGGNEDGGGPGRELDGSKVNGGCSVTRDGSSTPWALLGLFVLLFLARRAGIAFSVRK